MTRECAAQHGVAHPRNKCAQQTHAQETARRCGYVHGAQHFFTARHFFSAHGRSGMAESVLQPHRQEIARLYLERNTQAEIIRYLQQAHGINVNRSTLSRFLQSLPEIQQPQPGDPGISPEAERFLEQAEVYQKLQEASATLIESMSQNPTLEILCNPAPFIMVHLFMHSAIHEYILSAMHI
jgi:hypothetical protein